LSSEVAVVVPLWVEELRLRPVAVPEGVVILVPRLEVVVD
jgi:hypothetical protein